MKRIAGSFGHSFLVAAMLTIGISTTAIGQIVIFGQ